MLTALYHKRKYYIKEIIKLLFYLYIHLSPFKIAKILSVFNLSAKKYFLLLKILFLLRTCMRCFFTTFLLSFMYIKKSTRFVKIFVIRFPMGLHVLRCPKHDLIIFRKCLSVCTPPKFYGHCISRTNGRKLMKLYI